MRQRRRVARLGACVNQLILAARKRERAREKESASQADDRPNFSRFSEALSVAALAFIRSLVLSPACAHNFAHFCCVVAVVLCCCCCFGFLQTARKARALTRSCFPHRKLPPNARTDACLPPCQLHNAPLAQQQQQQQRLELAAAAAAVAPARRPDCCLQIG